MSFALPYIDQFEPYIKNGRKINNYYHCLVCHGKFEITQRRSNCYKSHGECNKEVYRLLLENDPATKEEKARKRAQWEANREKEKRQRLTGKKNDNSDNVNILFQSLYKNPSYKLRPEHGQSLLKRGFDEVDLSEFLSVEKGYNYLPDSIPDLSFVKIDSRFRNTPTKYFYSSVKGILIPFKDYKGRIIGCQINNLDPDNGKGKYLTIQDSQLFINNQIEIPLNIAIPNNYQGKEINTFLLTEGGIKSKLSAKLHNLPALGAQGGQFSNCSNQIKDVINHYGVTSVVIAPDGGDLINGGVRKKWSRQVRFFRSLGINVSFLWWEQWHKEDKSDIDEIDREVLTTAQLLTPDEFFKLPTNKAMAKKAWRNSKKFTPDVKINSQFFDYPFPSDNTILAIKSPLGTGKTEYVLRMLFNKTNLLDESKSERFIYPQYRNSLNLNFCSKVSNYFAKQLGKDEIEIGDEFFKYVNEYKAQDGINKLRDKNGKLPNVALCIDSFLLLNDEDFDGINLICDEIISMLKHGFFSDTLKENRVKILDKLEQAFIRSNSIILLDGNLADWAIKFVGKIATNKKIIRVENTYKKPNQEKDILYLWKGEIKDENLINPNKYSELINMVLFNCENTNEGNIQNIAIVSDSQKCVETLENLINKDYKNVKTLRVDRRTKGEEKNIEIYLNGRVQKCNEIELFMSNPDDYILRNQINVLLMTPTCESGLDISLKDNQDYFYCEYGFFFGVLDVDSILQIIKRVRPKMPRYIYCKPFSNIKESFSYNGNIPELILKDIQMRQDKMLNDLSFSNNIKEQEAINKLFQKLINANEKYNPIIAEILSFRKYEKANLRECLKERLQIEYEIIETALDFNQETMAKYTQEKEQIIEQEAQWIFESNILPDNFDNTQRQERPFKKLNPTISAPDQVSVNNWFYRQQLKGIEDTEIWSPELILEFLTNRNLLPSLRRFYLFNNDEILNNMLKADLIKKILNDYNSRIWSYDLPNQLRFIKTLKKTSFDKLLALPEYHSESQEIIDFIEEIKAKKLESELGFIGKMKPCQYIATVATKIGVTQKLIRESRKKGEKKINFHKLFTPSEMDHKNQILLDCIEKTLEIYLPQSEKMIKLDQEKSKFICEYFSNDDEINRISRQGVVETGKNELKPSSCKGGECVPPPPVNILNNIGQGWEVNNPSQLINNESHNKVDEIINNPTAQPCHPALGKEVTLHGKRWTITQIKDDMAYLINLIGDTLSYSLKALIMLNPEIIA